MELESEWCGLIKPENKLNKFNEINKEWEDLKDALDDIKNEIKKLKRKEGREQEIQNKEKELQEIKLKIKNLTKEKENLIIQLSKICIQFFPELKFENPELNIKSYLESDGLERNRKLSDYEEIIILQIEGGSRNTIYKTKWENEFCILKCFQLYNQNSLKSFKTETKSLNKLKHPNICEIECYFIEEDRTKKKLSRIYSNSIL
jgi:hypothetical protein